MTEISSVSPAAATYDPDISSTSSPVALSDAPIPPNVVSVEIPHNDHVMRTRGKRGFHLPINLSATTTISPIPTTYKRALLDPLWHAAMRDEFDALTQNNTWTLVPKPANANVVSGKWVFRH